jgi:pSer/pThr/pTyr-binding forkhead associated (FHA) protein
VDEAASRVLLEDNGSTNGTFVGHSAVTAPLALEDGDVIEIGSVELMFRAWSGEKQPETERIRRRRR